MKQEHKDTDEWIGPKDPIDQLISMLMLIVALGVLSLPVLIVVLIWKTFAGG